MNSSAGTAEVRRLSGVLFEMSPLDVNANVSRQHEMSIDVERLVVLADLVRLGKIGVEVVLAVEGAGLHAAVERKTDAHCQFHRVFVEHRQGTGQTERDGIDVGVGLVTESVRRATEQLRLGGQFDVHLEPNDKFPTFGQPVVELFDLAHAARSSSAATRNIVVSPSVGAST